MHENVRVPINTSKSSPTVSLSFSKQVMDVSGSLVFTDLCWVDIRLYLFGDKRILWSRQVDDLYVVSESVGWTSNSSKIHFDVFKGK